MAFTLSYHWLFSIFFILNPFHAKISIIFNNFFISKYPFLLIFSFICFYICHVQLVRFTRIINWLLSRREYWTWSTPIARLRPHLICCSNIKAKNRHHILSHPQIFLWRIPGRHFWWRMPSWTAWVRRVLYNSARSTFCRLINRFCCRALSDIPIIYNVNFIIVIISSFVDDLISFTLFKLNITANIPIAILLKFWIELWRKIWEKFVILYTEIYCLCIGVIFILFFNNREHFIILVHFSIGIILFSF